MNKILILFTTFFWIQFVFGESKILLSFKVEGKIHNSFNFSFFFLNKDTIIETGFQYVNLENLYSDKSLSFRINALDNYDTLKGIFTYETIDGVFEEEMTFLNNFQQLERTEINLIFTVNNSGEEYLKEFSINYFIHNQELKIETNFEKNINSVPNFVLTNPSNQTFWNYKEFNGEMRFNTHSQIGWLNFQGPHLPWFKNNKPITNGDIIYSTCEDYITYNNKIPAFTLLDTEDSEDYKFCIYMTKENYSNETAELKILGTKPLKKIRNVYIISKDFKIK